MNDIDVKHIPPLATQQAIFPSILMTGAIALILFFVPASLAGFAFGIYANSNAIENTAIWFAQVEVMMVMTFTVYFIVLPLVFLFTHFLKGDESISRYLNLRRHSLQTISKISLYTVGFWLVFTAISILLDIPEEPFMQTLKTSTLPVWFICLNVCLLAPVVEEVVFRGFIFKRIALTKMGNTGAAILTAVLFALIHSQYSMLGVVMVFLLGAYFTWIRLSYQSTSLAMIGHAMCNVLTMIALYWFD